MTEIGHAIEADTTVHDKEASENSTATDRIELAEEESEHDVLPNGGYGWVIVFSLLGLNACTWGINTTYGVFTSYFLEHNYYNAKQLDYAWVGGLSAAFAVSQGPLSNFLVRRFGIHVPMLIGAVAVGMGQIGSGLTSSFGPFLVCQGLVFGLGMGLILVPSQPILAHWFDRRLSLAQGIAQAGSGVGALFFSNITPLILDKLGVKKTYLINGCISLGVLIPCVLLMKGRHKAVGAKSAPMQLNFFWHPGYKYYLVWAFLCSESQSKCQLTPSDGILYCNLHPRLVLHQWSRLHPSTRRSNPIHPRSWSDHRTTSLGRTSRSRRSHEYGDGIVHHLRYRHTSDVDARTVVRGHGGVCLDLRRYKWHNPQRMYTSLGVSGRRARFRLRPLNLLDDFGHPESLGPGVCHHARRLLQESAGQERTGRLCYLYRVLWWIVPRRCSGIGRV